MKQIRFTIPGQPFGKQRPKFSRAGAYVKTYTPMLNILDKLGINADENIKDGGEDNDCGL